VAVASAFLFAYTSRACRRFAALLLICLLPTGAVVAASQIDTFNFADEVQERRYRALIEEFRCPKCLNTNLAGSDAPIAQDLRKVVYRLVVIEGKREQEVRDYLQARYGDFVLYDPPFNGQTWYIWLVPIGLGLLAVFVLIRLLRGARWEATVLDEQQQARLQEIVGHSKSSSGAPGQSAERK
jgi:cytochrome c-type biogenesis protein CcmH|tara:strand:+ start:7571 stop:8119 length:549 start_codon:yes stop_codon:yes gene_type:complete